MKKILLLLVVMLLGSSLAACEQTPDDDDRPDIPNIPVPGSGDDDDCFATGFEYDRQSLEYELVWSDEFDGDSLNMDNWTYEVNGDGGGNNELQYYTDQNATVQDGLLTITAKREQFMNHSYTSSRIVTRNKASWTYGLFEIRARVAPGRGTWPAVWMMPTTDRYGGWPDSGEIDIMEYVGYNDPFIHGTIHTEIFNGQIGTQKGGSTSRFDDVTTEFYTYKVEWLPDQIRWFVDDVNYYTYFPTSYSTCPTSEEWPFNYGFYMILNVAIGGDWGGVQGVDPNMFPTSMDVDYVRVYQSPTIQAFIEN